MVPSWWTAYNKVKHEYYRNLKDKATLGNVIDSLAGLLVLNALHKCSQEFLIRNRELKLGNLGVEHAIEDFKKTPKGMPQAS